MVVVVCYQACSIPENQLELFQHAGKQFHTPDYYTEYISSDQ